MDKESTPREVYPPPQKGAMLRDPSIRPRLGLHRLQRPELTHRLGVLRHPVLTVHASVDFLRLLASFGFAEGVSGLLLCLLGFFGVFFFFGGGEGVGGRGMLLLVYVGLSSG